MNQPNIIIFFTDDQRYDTIHALGNHIIKTPNLDKLVAKGITFTRAHIPGGTSGAVCMPSRAMLHTSKTLFHLDGEGQQIPTDHEMIGETFKEAGYETFGTGKWHNGVQSYARSFTDGGEIFFGGMWDHWNVPAYHYDPTGKYDNTSLATMDPFRSNKVTQLHCDHLRLGKHSSELFCNLAADYLRDYHSSKPFFMYISFMAPHDPRTMPDEFKNLYNPENMELPMNFLKDHPFDYGEKNERDEMLASYPRKEDEIKRHIAEYYGMITHLDNEMGKVLKVLEEKGLEENTIIVFAGDNGLSLGQHGLMGKQNLYDHSIRVPLIFAGKNIPENITTDHYAYLLDIYPTLCDLAEIEIPDSVEGRSLMPIIKDNKSVRDDLYLAFTDKIRGVKESRYKLIEYRTDQIRETQLFDLKKDPLEIQNLSKDPHYQVIIDGLRNKMFDYRDNWNDASHRLGKRYWSRF